MEPQPSPMSDRRNESYKDVQMQIKDEQDRRQYSTQTLPKEEKKRTFSERIKVR